MTFDYINDFPSLLTSGNGDSLANRFIYDTEIRLPSGENLALYD